MIADLLIDNTKDDFTTKMKNGADIRIVKYAIDNKSYYMATNLIDAEHFPISYIKVGSAATTDTGCAKGAIDWALRPTDGLLKNTCAEGAIC